MGKHLTQYQLGQIWAWRYPKPVLSFKKIAKKLRKDKSTISKAYSRMKRRGNSLGKSGSGRPRITWKNDDKRLVVTQKRDPFISTPTLQETLNLKCSTKTISRRLGNAGLRSFFTKKKPFISEKNRKKRLLWARKYRHWTTTQWKRVLFTDESPFTIRYQPRLRVWRPEGQGCNPRYSKGTVKHSKKINVWGGFSYNGVGKLYRVKGILEQKQMHQILIRQMKPSLKRLVGLKEGILQQDNHPKHTSKKCQNYLKKQKINVLPWPSQSPDLNPIENLWTKINVDCKDRKCKNEDELFEVLKKAWNELDKNYLESLVNSMPARCEAVIKSNGWPTKY